MFEIFDFLFDHLLGETATDVIARFCGSLATLLLLAGCSLLRNTSQLFELFVLFYEVCSDGTNFMPIISARLAK